MTMPLGEEKLPSNGLVFSCRERAVAELVKTPTISRAQRSAGTTYATCRTPVRQKLYRKRLTDGSF
jgi:hypothetical protein